MKKVVLADGKKLLVDETDLALLKSNDRLDERESFSMTLEALKLSHTLTVYYNNRQNLKLTSEVLGVSPNTARAILAKKIA